MRFQWVALGACCAIAFPPSAVGQDGAASRQVARALRDSVPVVASTDYGAGRVRRFLLGGGYRELWEAPIEVPVLDLGRFAGGLTATDRSGSGQTKGLKLVAADGREFRFRSVDKDPTKKVPDSLLTPTLRAVLDDQNSALHPAAGVTAAALAKAAGIPHTAPILVVLPNDRRLGKYREEFAGVLGTLEIYPDEGPNDRPGFMRYVDVVDTEKLVERLNASGADRVDGRAYLAARLFDMLINDWDRHPGQWRWGTRDRTAPRRWVAVPLDHDRAFSHYGGALLRLARAGSPKLVSFGPDIPLAGLTGNVEELDRRLLAGLERSEWDSVATALQRRLNDAAIAAALKGMPEAYRELSAAKIGERLRFRRDKLSTMAAKYYAQLARAVDIHATDANDRATIRQLDDGGVEVALAGVGDSSAYFRRLFVPTETGEVRVYLHGGDDVVETEGGERSPIMIRVIGGKGKNQLPADSARPANVRFYGNLPSHAPDTVVAALDRRPWTRGRGGRLEPPIIDYGSKVGPTFGASHRGRDFKTGFEAGVAAVEYGFRHEPYKRRLALVGGYSIGADAFGAMASADFTAEESPRFWRISAMASGLEHPWFYGLGNNTTRGESREENRLGHREYSGFLELGMRRRQWSLSVGPLVKYSTTDDLPTSVANQSFRGAGNYGQVGVRALAELDTRNEKVYPTRGVRLSLDGAVYPALWDNEGTFGGGEVKAATYLSAPLPLTPVLALRVGARRMWGPYPWFEAAFLGGRSTLRGFGQDRFAGDASVWGGGDLRLKLARVPVVLPMDVGVFGLADVGRVWLDGESFNRWHTSYGAGIWAHALQTPLRGSIALVWGDGRSLLYIGSGFHF